MGERINGESAKGELGGQASRLGLQASGTEWTKAPPQPRA